MTVTQPAPPKISVCGNGVLFKHPDRAVICIKLRHESTDPDEASSKVMQHAAALTSLLETLSPKTDGVINDDAPVTWWTSGRIAKSSCIIFSEGGPKLNHAVSQRFDVKYQDLQKLTDLIVDCINDPFCRVESFLWDFSEKTKIEALADARALAVRDATTKAQDFARPLGFSKVQIINLLDRDNRDYSSEHSVRDGFGPETLLDAEGNLDETAVDPKGTQVRFSATVQGEFVAV